MIILLFQSSFFVTTCTHRHTLYMAHAGFSIVSKSHRDIDPRLPLLSRPIHQVYLTNSGSRLAISFFHRHLELTINPIYTVKSYDSRPPGGPQNRRQYRTRCLAILFSLPTSYHAHAAVRSQSKADTILAAASTEALAPGKKPLCIRTRHHCCSCLQLGLKGCGVHPPYWVANCLRK